jgi:flagellar motor switch protein FliN/FliY
MSEQTQMAPTHEESATALPSAPINIGKTDQAMFHNSAKLAAVRPHEDGNGASTVEFGVLRQVPMTVQVEVGRTSMTLGEVLDELEVGSSIRLDRHAGDPVEVYINGALFARAEVVVLQDQIGARIIELVDPAHNTRPSGLR